MDDDFPSIDSLFENDDYSIDQSYILFLGRTQLFQDFIDPFPKEMGFDIIHAEKVEDAIGLFLEKEIMIVFIDANDKNFDVISISNSLRQTNPLTRNVLISPRLESYTMSTYYNNGAIDGILDIPFNTESIIKIIGEQEARYSINKGVTDFVKDPPKLSKASFLLLDPTLSFGDEKIPLNFVGLMIVSNTVPIYSRWFEDTLAQDEYLLAGYLSSITALGDDLFRKRETIKEINFGGISVIFRFEGNIQFSFLVKNLTKYNVENAEERISDLVDKIITNYGTNLNQGILSSEAEKSLTEMVDHFDSDDVINEIIHQLKEDEKIEQNEKSLVLFYGSDINHQYEFIEKLRNIDRSGLPLKYQTLEYILESTDDEVVATSIIRNQNCDVLILDNILDSGRTPVDFADFAKEMKPPIQIIFLERHLYCSEFLLNVVNSDYIDLIYPYQITPEDILHDIHRSIESSINIKQQTATKGDFEMSSNSMIVAKMKLRQDLEAYDQEEQPILHGLIITRNMEEIYDKFWEVVEFDKSMITGMIESLKSVGGEMFKENENIDGLEVAGTTLFVRHSGDFMFIYFVKHVTPNTSVIIGKEIETVTSLFHEIIEASFDVLPLQQIIPFFEKIATKAHYSFTDILSETIETVDTSDELSLNDVVQDFIPQKEEIKPKPKDHTQEPIFDVPILPKTEEIEIPKQETFKSMPGVQISSIPDVKTIVPEKIKRKDSSEDRKNIEETTQVDQDSLKNGISVQQAPVNEVPRTMDDKITNKESQYIQETIPIPDITKEEPVLTSKDDTLKEESSTDRVTPGTFPPPTPDMSFLSKPSSKLKERSDEKETKDETN